MSISCLSPQSLFIHRFSMPLLLSLLALTACSSDKTIDPTQCDAKGEMTPICGFSNPEDFALMPDGKTLVISEYGNYFLAGPGTIVLYNTETGNTQRLPPLEANDLSRWGSPDCPGAPGKSLSPHGIYLSRRPDGRLQLLVVNHGGAERVELVELMPSEGGYKGAWRGCVVAPEDSFINSVAATPEGGMVFTHMYSKSSPRLGTTALAVALSTLGRASGYAIEWRLLNGQDEFSIIEASRDGFPNGILVGPNGKYIYMAASTGSRVIKIDRQSGARVAEVEVTHPDNLRWTADGKILVASMPMSSLEGILCQEASLENVNCGGAFQIVRLDPATMQTEVVFSHAGGQPMGVATAAQQVGEVMYIGSFAGNRMVRVPY